MNRITIFVGEFGSGKTELSMNYSIYLKKHGYLSAIVDMDLVKPYFRTRENASLLEEKGIKVVAPDKNLSNADLPILPSELTRILNDEAYHVVMDVGGGESAVVLGQFRKRLEELNPQVIMVVNTCRPFTSTRDGILSSLKRIEGVSGLTVTGFVSNTNIGQETSAQHVTEGYKLLSAVAQEVQLPLLFTVIPEWLLEDIKLEAPVFVLQPFTRYPWMD